MKLEFCDKCQQMTNHGCLKCHQSDVIDITMALVKQVIEETFHYPTTPQAKKNLQELKKMLRERP